MPKSTRRTNAKLLRGLVAAGIGLLGWAGLTAMQARPEWLPVVVGLLAALAAYTNPELGVLVVLLGVSVPLLALNLAVGLVAILVLFTAEHYLGGGGGTNFLLIGLALVGAFFGPVWAAAALAGYLLGPAEGALVAVFAGAAVEAVGILTAKASIGAAVGGGSGKPVLDFAQAPATLLSGDWIASSFAAFSRGSVSQLYGALMHVNATVALLAQLTLWAVGAIVVGLIMSRATTRPPLWMPLAAVSAGVTAIWVADAALRIGLGMPLGTASSIAFATSLVVAAGVVLARETLFTAVPVAAPEVRRPSSLAAEDADVDELLRLIATAEDKLASQHTTRRVVLITDMKSFSRMTEEDGSVASAKAIQRHRDILVPIISANNGCGKSTGGDGVVAAFESPADAIRAAVAGQRALAEHNASHGNEREIWVRMGLAEGEVVLDNGGRPFIGAALNLAARVMNLADGGQIFSAGSIAEAASDAGATAYLFGPFELKNIANPTDIAEILWAENQIPRDPRVSDSDG